MRREVAVHLLGEVMGTDVESTASLVDDLQTLAHYKYDAYEGYRPGTRFLESVIRWIARFRPEDRPTAARFARTGLVFVSRAELHHLVELVYPSVVRPAVVSQVSERMATPSYLAPTISASMEFAALQRATLVLGLSDGARLDLLRRLSSHLRHEQFSPVTDLSEPRLDEMLSSLEADQSSLGFPRERRFGLVMLVDDFAATGTTLLRKEEGRWDGRLWKAQQQISTLVERGALSTDHRVRLLLYIATEQAERRLRGLLADAGLRWEVDAVQTIPDGVRVTPDRDPELFELCSQYADGSSVEYVTGARGPLAFGCGGAALPVVLYHNTPNNSISLLWQHGSDAPDGPRAFPLFPRYERYP